MRDGANTYHSTLSDSDTSGCFETTKLGRMSVFGDDSCASDAAYEGADFFEVGDRKGMELGCVIGVGVSFGRETTLSVL